MSPEQHQLLAETARGTRMGELLRRFWTPVLLSSELLADGAPDGLHSRRRLPESSVPGHCLRVRRLGSDVQRGVAVVSDQLARVGGKYNHAWHFDHMDDPRSISIGSNMPRYSWLKEWKTDAILQLKLLFEKMQHAVPLVDFDSLKRNYDILQQEKMYLQNDSLKYQQQVAEL